jgi:hypothetical protein
MKLKGYSERGIVNALFYEILYSISPESLLENFISIIQFPFIDQPEFRIKKDVEIEIFIEQSFSDFGDVDALILIETEVSSAAIFIEAKVKTYSTPHWTIDSEYDKFLNGIKEERVISSNLFAQLYHKVKMTEELRLSGIPVLQSGIQFPKCSSKKIRKIGKNQIVLRAVKRLKDYLGHAYYVAILPDSSVNMSNFYNSDRFSRYKFNDFKGWNTDAYGYISWADVEKFCRDNNLNNTLRVFEFNEGQIYSK